MTFAKMKTKAASLKEIASAAGVSEATVSRVINGKGELSAKTRDRVMAVAQKFNRQENRLVRGFQTGQTQLVGVLIRPNSPYSSQIFAGVHDTLAKKDCAPLVLYPDREHGITEQHQLQKLLAYRVDGILLMPSMFEAEDSYFKDAWDRGIPITCIDGWMCKTHTDLATFDNQLGGRLAAEHLLSHGHRHIGQLHGPHYHPVAKDRRNGFEQALNNAGVKQHDLETRSFSSCPGKVETFLEKHPQITAIFAANDHMAEGVYQAAANLGLRIPEDLSVIGFADLPLATQLNPQLTTIRQDAYALGCEAVELMFKRMTGKLPADSPASIYLPVQLVDRQSVRQL